eukprot:9474372-Pyramimonas_sp.AAC.1
MWAKWPDGYVSELSTLTVSAWRGMHVAAGGKNSLKLLSAEGADGTTYLASLKQLDRDNPGVAVKVDGSQKAQLSFKAVPEGYARKYAVTWVKLLAANKMKVEDLKAKKAEVEKIHSSGSAKKRPAASDGGGGGGGCAKRPAAAQPADDVGGGCISKAESDPGGGEDDRSEDDGGKANEGEPEDEEEEEEEEELDEEEEEEEEEDPEEVETNADDE